jgi:hypothetical protein
VADEIKKISSIIIKTADGQEIPAQIVLPLTQIEVEEDNLETVLSWQSFPIKTSN